MSTTRSAKPQAVRIVLADDDPIVRDVLRHLLTPEAGYEVVAEAPDGRQAIDAIEKLHPDVLLLDLLMPNMPGLEALREITDKDAKLRTIVLTSSINKRQIVEALQLGARGILLKSTLDQLFHCINAVRMGEYWIDGQRTANVMQVLQQLSQQERTETKSNYGLTDREMEVVRLVCEGLGNKEIADRLQIAGETVKRHMTNIFNKVGMSSRLELALFAIDHQLVSRQ
ncbi:MAG TPA: response regulator transcription factor [Terriglobales bacterium]|nr:response regulator transcription factor [Terriglobales bacterium]